MQPKPIDGRGSMKIRQKSDRLIVVTKFVKSNGAKGAAS